MKTTRVFVFMGLLASMEVVLTRFLSIQTPIVRIGFGFLPVALASMLFGPVLGGLSAMFSDIAGMMLFPQGVYFPGFTLSALLTGVAYGLLLYQKPKTILRIVLAVSAIAVFIDLGLNTYWLSIITGKAASVLIVPRLVKSAVMFPVQVFLIHAVWRYAGYIIQTRFTGVPGNP